MNRWLHHQWFKRCLSLVCMLIIVQAAAVHGMYGGGRAIAASAAKPIKTDTLSVMKSPRFDAKDWLQSPEWYEMDSLTGIGAPGYRDGSVDRAAYRNPSGLFAAADGSLLVADTGNHIIRKWTMQGTTSIAGAWLAPLDIGLPNGGWHDSKAATALFNEPSSIVQAQDGTVYVADSGNHVIRKIDPMGNVTTIAGDGLAGLQDGVGAKARFHSPHGIALAEDGTLYVADSLNHVIRSIDSTGKVVTLTAPTDRIVEYSKGAIAAAGDYKDGALEQAKFNEPSAIIVAQDGTLIISDSGNQRIRQIDLKKRQVSTIAGGNRFSSSQWYAKNSLYAPPGYRDGAASEAWFHYPVGLAELQDGSLVVADRNNHAIRLIRDKRVYTIAGSSTTAGYQDGIASQALLHEPTGVAVLPNGAIAITDSFNSAIRILKHYQLPEQALDQLAAGVEKRPLLVYNQQLIVSDAPPLLHEGRTYLPIRALGDAIGLSSAWDASDGKAKLSAGETAYHFEPNEREAVRQVGSKSEAIMMDQAPLLIKGRLYVPVRFFAEEFGFRVDWIQALDTIVVRDAAYVKMIRHSSAASLKQ